MVVNRLDEAGNHKNPTIANGQREREFAKCMGDNMLTSAAGFADPAAAARSKQADDADEDEMSETILESGY